MAAVPPPPEIGLNGVRLALTRCGASLTQRDAIIQEGFTGMDDLLFMDESDVERMMSNITKLRANQGGVRIGALLTKKVQALVYWAKEQDRHGMDLDANRFTELQVRETIGQMMVENIDDDSKPELPAKHC
jgi:hypothetical protein